MVQLKKLSPDEFRREGQYLHNQIWRANVSVLKQAPNTELTCVIFSLLALGLRGASVRRTGCSSGATRSSL